MITDHANVTLDVEERLAKAAVEFAEAGKALLQESTTTGVSATSYERRIRADLELYDALDAAGWTAPKSVHERCERIRRVMSRLPERP
jgi:hypothetical protein